MSFVLVLCLTSASVSLYLYSVPSTADNFKVSFFLLRERPSLVTVQRTRNTQVSTTFLSLQLSVFVGQYKLWALELVPSHSKPPFNFFPQLSSHDINIYFFLYRCDPTRPMASSFIRFLDHTQRCTTVGRSPLDEGSALRRNLYRTTNNTHNKDIHAPAGFEPTISAGE